VHCFYWRPEPRYDAVIRQSTKVLKRRISKFNLNLTVDQKPTYWDINGSIWISCRVQGVDFVTMAKRQARWNYRKKLQLGFTALHLREKSYNVWFVMLYKSIYCAIFSAGCKMILPLFSLLCTLTYSHINNRFPFIRLRQQSIERVMDLTDRFTWEDLQTRDADTGHLTAAGWIPLIKTYTTRAVIVITVFHTVQSAVRILTNHETIFIAWYPFDWTVSPFYELVNISQVTIFSTLKRQNCRWKFSYIVLISHSDISEIFPSSFLISSRHFPFASIYSGVLPVYITVYYQRSPSQCCVSEIDREASVMRRLITVKALAQWKKEKRWIVGWLIIRNEVLASWSGRYAGLFWTWNTRKFRNRLCPIQVLLRIIIYSYRKTKVYS
jgi:hypothetical protein